MSKYSLLPKIPNKRKHWGDMNEEVEDERQEIKVGDMISSKMKLDSLINRETSKAWTNNSTRITMDNKIVTQTIEVMNQTEVIQSLIDTYTSNNTGNPTALMPQIDFPPETTSSLVRDDKFLKPLWYLPPVDTDFTRGVPVRIPTITKSVVMEALRKTISGLLRLKGFHEANESALVMMTDGVDEYFKCFMESINDILVNEGRDLHVSKISLDLFKSCRTKTLNVTTVERAYFALSRNSLTSLHNYYKHDIVQRNQTERAEFQEIFHEYDRLMQQSQTLHKNDIKQEDYVSLQDYTVAPGGSTVIQHTDDSGVINILNFLNADQIHTTGFQGAYDSNVSNMIGKTITTITSDELTQ